ncbi:hypothetical protein ACHAXT_008109 [Thalassiosira profunda]
MDFIKDLNIDKVRNLAEDAFNQVKPKNDVEARVYEVLSHKNWGASTTLMNEIAQDTFDYERCECKIAKLPCRCILIVTKLMWEAIETPRPSAWRVVFKGLTLLEHLVKNGSERCVDDARNHSHLLRNLERFNYYEGTVDRGLGVREKSKQVVEILQDDERIREERQKARQLREKFAGRSTATNSSGGGGGGSKYAGYGNSDANWNSGGGGGRSKGYGDSGIGSSRGDSNRGYAGRYGEGGVDSTPSRSAAGPRSPTVASSARKSTKTKKVKKKEKKVEAAAPEVDLFGFDDAPAAAPAPAADDFGAFQTTPAPAPVAAAPAPADDFGDFQQIAPTSAVQFDAFGSAPTPAQQPAFDAFGAAPAMQPQQPAMNGMNNAFGNMTMQNQQQMSAAPATDNDDFGDFAGAAESNVPNSPVKSSDPMANLISLDGLSKNVKKEVKDESKPPLNFGPGGGSGGMMAGGQQGFPQQPILGKGQEGDVGEVFGQLMASGNNPMGQRQGMGMNQQGMGMQQPQGMMNGGMGGMQGQMGMGGMQGGMNPMMQQQGMMQGQQMPMQGQMNQMNMMQGNTMQGNSMQGQGQMSMGGGYPNQGMGQMNMQQPQMNMMGGNMMGGQSGQGQFR